MFEPSEPRAAAPQTIMAAPAWRPSPKAKLLWGIKAAIVWVVLFVVQIGYAIADSAHLAIHLVILVLTVLFAVAHVVGVPSWRYRVHRWEITDEAVYIRVGWFSQSSRVAPISRVQTVDTERGPLERLFGLATVTVTTASSAGAVRISELDNDVAEETVLRLTRIASLHRGDAT
ncbi:PH domain-containing protein [Nocardia callitridis]|uniref:PH domain-containing protein n=1 Tax=Nocardia callitridis TaxID=648753 RepID=A0ABP9JRS1_9NOCA